MMNISPQFKRWGQNTRNLQQQEAYPLREPPFDTYMVLDFEATCERHQRLEVPEVIEFPIVLVDARNGNTISEFQQYVRPVVNPQLSQFCTELTGITQSVVDRASTFPDVFTAAMNYLHQNNCGETEINKRYLPVTCGDWDLKTMLPIQVKACIQQGFTVNVPPSLRRWFNIKQYMQRVLSPGLGQTVSQPIRDLPDMMSVLGLEMKGRHHSGIDDCRNIAAVLCELIKLGHVITPTTDYNSELTRGTSWVSVGATTSLKPSAGLGKCQQMPHCREEGSNNSAMGRKRAASDTVNNQQSMIKRIHINVLENEDPLQDLLNLKTDDRNRMGSEDMTKEKVVTYSKALSRILRHGADKMKITISDAGYVLADDLVRCAPFSNDKAALTHLAWVVYSNDKKRFKMAYDENRRVYIRANQGHSLSGINPELVPITSETQVPFAVHGTYYSAWERIRGCGYLSTMGRQHIHFAKGMPGSDGVISGMRNTSEVLLVLDVPLLLKESVELWESANGVLLTPGVSGTGRLPLKYISSVVDRRTNDLLPR
ncbi:phosphotransferase, putative [Trypanosoma equiperdum]|uniref:2'-phosphotransferase n=1 Tax=Trypanosoma equiperdum TaxID=5694 RepID=A0A1G4I3I3_TRYEQ|nr:phosphotransferase, putative [Trypanosoma equiperdum]